MMQRNNGARDDEDQERPKAEKPATTIARARGAKKMNYPDLLLRTFELLILKAINPFIKPAPIENYPLLVGDVAMLFSFRIFEDLMQSPFPSLDIYASPDLIANGIHAYADPATTLSHFYR